MCNEAARRIALGIIREDWSQLKIPLLFPESLPNLQAVDSFRITDTTLIFRAAQAPEHQHAAEAVMRRWSWPGPSGKPVYNYRSDAREFRNGATQGRCLIAADAFYEFTDPISSPLPLAGGAGGGNDQAARASSEAGSAPPPTPPASGRGARKRKNKWSFAKTGEDWFCIAGLWRAHADVGEAFTMLTTEPGPDVAPYHSRQIVILERADWGRWLDGSAPAAELCRPLPAGALTVSPVAN